MLQGMPTKCTTAIAFVRGVIAARIASAVTLPLRRSQSTKTEVAPTHSAVFAVAACVCAGMITSSPGPTPKYSNARWSAAAPELIDTQCASAPANSANSLSNPFASGPCARIGPSSTFSTAWRSSSFSHGRPNGIVLVAEPAIDATVAARAVGPSGVLDNDPFAFCEGAIGRRAGTHEVELV